MIWIHDDIQDYMIYKLIEITTLLVSKFEKYISKENEQFFCEYLHNWIVFYKKFNSNIKWKRQIENFHNCFKQLNISQNEKPDTLRIPK